MVYRALDFVICYCLRSSTIRVHTWNCSRLPLHLGRFFDPILRKRSATQIFLRQVFVTCYSLGTIRQPAVSIFNDLRWPNGCTSQVAFATCEQLGAHCGMD